MKQLWVGMALPLFFACTRGSSPSGAEIARHSDSGIVGGAYADLIAGLQTFAESHSDLVTTETYGTSVGGRPLFLLRVASAHPPGGKRPVVVLTQAIHGDEYLGIVDRLPGEFLDHPNEYPSVTRFVAEGGVLLTVPIANPDGYEARRRENAHGVDLNRNFDVERYVGRVAEAEKGTLVYTDEELRTLKQYVASPKFTEPETRLIADEMSRAVDDVNGSVKLAFDYHCCQDENFGSLMHEWGDTKDLRDGTIAAADVPRYEAIAAIFKGIFPDHLWGSGYQIVKYLTFGTTDEWFYEKFADDGALAFCYEGQRGSESGKLKDHARMWDRMLSSWR